MAAPAPASRGLTASELAAACTELQACCGAVVREAVPLAVPAGADDLLLVLDRADGAPGRLFLHIAPGGTRARLTLTAARFPATAFARGPARDLLQQALDGARLSHVAAAEGERRCTLHFATAHGDRRLVVELFGARGLWALLDAEGRAVVLSRVVETAVRTLRLHDRYEPPPPAADRRPTEPSPRFAAPVLAAIDAHFLPLDQFAADVAEHDALLRAAARALQRAQARVQGLGAQLADSGRTAMLREQADLMLAYAHTVPRGASAMRVPDPARDGAERTIELDPARPVVVQANALYAKARAYDDGRAIAAQRLATAQAAVADLQPLAAALTALRPDAPDLAAQLAPLRAALQERGVLPPAPRAATSGKTAAREHPRETFRRYVSAEGYPIWVGRNNEQNDRLTLRIANGNDLWLHVGGGRAGSHVVVRLPKGKTASLETLLDAGTLAVHFSKARGEARIEVVYTQKKHVRKPKGLPAGAVVPTQTKTITVLRDESRLVRLLGDGGAGGEGGAPE